MKLEARERLQDEKMCRQAIDFISLISNETRLRILCVLNHGSFCVSEIADRVGGKHSNVSQQLKILAVAGVVKKERRERSVYYRLEDSRVGRLLGFLRGEFGASH